MMLGMREIMNTEKSTELALLSGLMVLLISVNFTTIISMEKVFTLGPIIENTKVTGEQTKCTVKEPLIGLMVENMWVSTQKIRKRATVNLFGQMAGVTEASG